MSTCKYIDASIIEKQFDAKTVEETRQMQFIISTATKDRGGEVINMDNWHLEQYKANPIVGYQHEVYGGGLFGVPNPDYIIGKSETNMDSFKGKRVLVSKATFEPEKINPLAEKVFQKLLFGSLNAASVGILPVGQGRYEKDTKTYFYEGQELLEWSVVNIPMNGEARRMSMKSLMTAQAVELFRKIHVDEKLKQAILDQIEKEYGEGKAECFENPSKKMLMKGDKVRVRQGMGHMQGHEDMTMTVEEVSSQRAVALKMDNGMIHKWYIEDELEKVEGGMTMNGMKKIAGIDPDLVKMTEFLKSIKK